MVTFVSSVTLLAGCGSSSSGGSGGGGAVGTGTNNSSQAPAAELASAVTALGNTSSLSATLKLGATTAEISGLASAHGSTLSSAETSAIAGAQISIQVDAPSGKTLADIGSGTAPSGFALTITDNGTNFISLRSVGQTLYLQADLKDLLNTIGKGSVFASIQAESAELPSFVQALVADKWISLPDSTLKSLEGSLGGAAGGSLGVGGSSAPSSPNPAEQEQLLTALKSVLTSDVTVTRVSSGTTDKLDLSGNLRTIVSGFIGAVSSVVPSASALGNEATSKVPDETITLNASVTGGALSEVSLDLGQFDHSSKESFPLDLLFTRGASAITAPSGAVAVDSTQLSELFSGLAGGLGSS